MNLAPHPTQIGKYKVTGTIGAGAMGVVYRADDPVSGRMLAIKTLRLADQSDVEGFQACERFRREGKAGAALSHPNIVKVHEYGEADGLAYIAMDFIEGASLRDLNARQGRWPLPQAFHLIYQLLDALEHLHKRGIVHRDIKPSNLMVDARNHLTITDFGIARVENSTLTQVGTVLGTPWYMSPEQITEMPVDGRSDLFSVGILLYEMLTGLNPFKAEQLMTVLDKIVVVPHAAPSSFVTGLPPALDVLFERALAKKPIDRFQKAEEFRSALKELQSSLLPAASVAATQPQRSLNAEQVAALASLELSLQDREVREKPRSRAIIWLVAGLGIASTLLLFLPGNPPGVAPQTAKPPPAVRPLPVVPDSPPLPGQQAATTSAETSADAAAPEDPVVADIQRQCASDKIERVRLPDINGIVRCDKSALCDKDAGALAEIHRRLSSLLAPESSAAAEEIQRAMSETGCSSAAGMAPAKPSR